MSAPITFLSDYGLDDDFVGVCHAVISGIAPHSRVIDLSHGVPRHDVRSGALILRRSLPYCPAGVHLAVVDPEVGGERAAIALRTAEEDRILVGTTSEEQTLRLLPPLTVTEKEIDLLAVALERILRA